MARGVELSPIFVIDICAHAQPLDLRKRHGKVSNV